MEAIGLPEIPLIDGPYDGHTSKADEVIESVLFFPHEIHVRGIEGWTVYRLATRHRKIEGRRVVERIARFEGYG